MQRGTKSLSTALSPPLPEGGSSDMPLSWGAPGGRATNPPRGLGWGAGRGFHSKAVQRSSKARQKGSTSRGSSDTSTFSWFSVAAERVQL